MKLSAIIACYGDERAIPEMHRRLKRVFTRLKCQGEIIFVVDGSPDNSEAVVRKLAARDPQVIGIFHSRNFGSQMAFTSGMEVATGDAIILLDGDLQDPPELILKFVKRWQQGNQVVYGVRIKRQASWAMSLSYKLFYRVFQRLSYVNMPLDAGDFSLIDRRVVEELKKFPERDRFVRGLRAWVGFRQTGVPYVRPERKYGRTTNSLWKNFRWAVMGIFSFSYAPLQAMTTLALMVFVVAVMGIVAQIVLRLLYPDTPHGITTILVVVLFMGAIQLLGISVLGEYLAKIFEEVKARPKFVVREVVGRETEPVIGQWRNIKRQL